MEDESKYRVENAEDEPAEKKGLFRPLPTKEGVGESAADRTGRSEPIARFLGITMRERRRDLLVLFLVPMLAGLADAAVYSYIIIGSIESTGLFTFVIPLLAAIPVGLTQSKASYAMLAALIAALFYLLFFVLFLASPGIQWPVFDLGEFIVSGFFIAAIYLLLVILASLMGSLLGTILREFF
ncbi:MAG: hypothetical protein EAX95_15545 [Candidatus Thorarchaeota archaeon]|nr:hypothetical protein [Candidatus Thorarchaeota archaeon]